MLYTEDFTMRHYVGFLQIGSHIIVLGGISYFTSSIWHYKIQNIILYHTVFDQVTITSGVT